MMVFIRSILVSRVMAVLYYCCCRTANGFVVLDRSADNFPVGNTFAVRQQAPPFHTTSTHIDLQPSVSATALKSFTRDIITTVPIPIWPYLGCSGQCGGGPLGLFLSLALCGVGLPISEDVLLIGLAPRLFGSPGSIVTKLGLVLAAVTGAATADTLTVGIGRALRVNSKVIGDQAPRFIGRMLVAIRKQLVAESKRDGERLRKQIEGRLRSATIDLGEQLRKLQGAILRDNSSDNDDESATPTRTEVLWQRLKLSNQSLRRITCNTRTSLAAWGQTSATLTNIVLSRSTTLFKLPSFLSPKATRNRTKPTTTDNQSRSSGIDNRLALGQRWPLLLLTGFSASSYSRDDYTNYYTGAALAAGTVTLPVQLLLGIVLRRSKWARGIVYLAIGTAQLCRYGPIWAAVFVAIGETVRAEIEEAKKKGEAKKKAKGG